MKKIFCMLISMCLITIGCTNTDYVQITFPTDGYKLETLHMTVKGKVTGNEDYIFYQVEDGHGFLGEGKIDIRKDKTFETEIQIKAPSNPSGMLLFYLDLNQNGQFDIEGDTEEKIGMVSLRFDESIVKY